uniref:Uncharacterized protein n=1 Tax=Glossina austeni TaxID=7395 RepID=A0A1A9UWP3_GLOAU
MLRKLKGLLSNSNNSFVSCIIIWETYSNEVNRKKEESEGEKSESVSFQQQHKKQGSEEQQKTTSTSFVPAVRNPFPNITNFGPKTIKLKMYFCFGISKRTLLSSCCEIKNSIEQIQLRIDFLISGEKKI